MTCALGVDLGGSSVKLALLTGHGPPRTAASHRYDAATPETVTHALRDALGTLRPPAPITTLAVCCPGIVDIESLVIEQAVNVPLLVGANLHELLARCLPEPVPRPTLCSDAHAAALDFWSIHRPRGRLLALSLGTGVGACVLDEGVPLDVDAGSPGHFGQIDVGVVDAHGHVPLGPDHGSGSLEGYLSAPRLRTHFGEDLEAAASHWTSSTPELVALARAIRIAHAIYRPHHIVLLGGVGLALVHALPTLQHLVDDHLTSIARPGVALTVGDSKFHAASGAARLALREPS